jgi:hypothetical protein
MEAMPMAMNTTDVNERKRVQRLVTQFAEHTGCTGMRWQALTALTAWLTRSRRRFPAVLLGRASVAPTLIERLRSTTRGEVAAARKEATK